MSFNPTEVEISSCSNDVQRKQMSDKAEINEST